MLDVFLNRALPYVLKMDFSLNLETADPARLAACFCFSPASALLGFQVHTDASGSPSPHPGSEGYLTLA